MILANLSIPLLGAVDTAVIGHSAHAYNLSAVAIGSTIIHFIFWAFGFLRMGLNGLTAQAYGADDAVEMRTVFLRGALAAGGIGLLLWALQVPVFSFALTLFEGSSEAESLAQTYFQIRIWSAPAVLLNYCLMGWFIGMHNTRAVLYVQVLMNGINIILDLYFVVGLGWGVAGVAWATLIAEVTAVLFGLFIYRREVNKFDPGGRYGKIWVTEKIRHMFALNFDIFIRTISLLFAFSFFTSQASRFGDATIAAHLVLIQFQQFLAFGLDGFAQAAEALVGSSIGTKNKQAVRNAVVVSTKWAGGIAVGYTVVYFFAGKFIIQLLTSIPDVQAVANAFLFWVVLSPIISVWSFQLDGIFIGATRSKEMRNGMVISLIVFVCAAFLLKENLGYGGIWLAFILFMTARAVTLGIYYPRIERDAT